MKKERISGTVECINGYWWMRCWSSRPWHFYHVRRSVPSRQVGLLRLLPWMREVADEIVAYEAD